MEELPTEPPKHVTGAEHAHAISHPKYVTELTPALLAKLGSKGNFGINKDAFVNASMHNVGELERATKITYACMGKMC